MGCVRGQYLCAVVGTLIVQKNQFVILIILLKDTVDAFS